MTVGTAGEGSHPMTTPNIPVKHETAIQVVHYLLSKVPAADKINIVKMAYVADKLHLLHYARTITRDEYFAMKYGPIGSNVLDICNLSTFIGRNTLQYASKYLEVVDETKTKVKQEMEHDLLSETDFAMLDQAIAKYKSGEDLVDFTHTFPEWKKFEADLLSGRTRKEPIPLDSMFALPPAPINLGVSEQEAKESKEIAAEVC
jgi:hypothetical protein